MDGCIPSICERAREKQRRIERDAGREVPVGYAPRKEKKRKDLAHAAHLKHARKLVNLMNGLEKARRPIPLSVLSISPSRLL